MSDAINKIKSRIQALLAKAGGTDNEHEAEAFLTKAHELLEQYQLDIMDLVGEDDPIIHHVGLQRAVSGHPWRWKLYSQVAQMYGCKSIHCDIGYMRNEDGSYKVNKAGKRILGYEQRIVGRESSVITTDLMYPWIVSQVVAAGGALAKKTGLTAQGQTQRVALALVMRIRLINRANKEQAPTTAAGKNALVILNQVEAQYESLYPAMSLMRSRGHSVDGLSAQAAAGIGLHRQTGHAKQLKLA